MEKIKEGGTVSRMVMGKELGTALLQGAWGNEPGTVNLQVGWERELGTVLLQEGWGKELGTPGLVADLEKESLIKMVYKDTTITIHPKHPTNNNTTLSVQRTKTNIIKTK